MYPYLPILFFHNHKNIVCIAFSYEACYEAYSFARKKGNFQNFFLCPRYLSMHQEALSLSITDIGIGHSTYRSFMCTKLTPAGLQIPHWGEVIIHGCIGRGSTGEVFRYSVNNSLCEDSVVGCWHESSYDFRSRCTPMRNTRNICKRLTNGSWNG